MQNIIVRIENITLDNLKNVTHGSLDLENSHKFYNASILGLYGQNGSGKTSVIDALTLLKCALSGTPIPMRFADLINVDAEYAALQFDIKIVNKDLFETYDVKYRFMIRKDMDDTDHNTDSPVQQTAKAKPVIFAERLTYVFEGQNGRERSQTLADTAKSNVFGPKNRYDLLVDSKKYPTLKLMVAKQLTQSSSRSFIFSKELLTAIRESAKGENGLMSNVKDPKSLFVLETLVRFGNHELFVIDNQTNGLITGLNALPLSFRYEGEKIGFGGNVYINLNGPSSVPSEAFGIVQKVLQHMNVVLAEIIPGLTIGVVKLGERLTEDSIVFVDFQVISHKNSKEIPLQYESDGIKKIVSVLHLLIGVYNQNSLTVAIDELDAGIFEYLLGELLYVISEKGKGQLIFTSHNLRPLETLDRGFVAFTTTDPNERYVRITNLKNNNNLRATYYRNIILEDGSAQYYDATNNHKIAFAFRKAGRIDG